MVQKESFLRHALARGIYYTHSGLWTGKIFWFHLECCDYGYSWGFPQKQFHSYSLTWIPAKKCHPLVDDSHFSLLISGLFTRASAFYFQLHYRTYFLGYHLTHNMIRLILTFSPFLNFPLVFFFSWSKFPQLKKPLGTNLNINIQISLYTCKNRTSYWLRVSPIRLNISRNHQKKKYLMPLTFHSARAMCVDRMDAPSLLYTIPFL